MDDLKKFQEEEERRRLKSKEKREARERDEAMIQQMRERQDRVMASQQKDLKPPAYSTGKGGAPMRSNVGDPKPGQTSGVNRQVIVNNRKPTDRTGGNLRQRSGSGTGNRLGSGTGNRASGQVNRNIFKEERKEPGNRAGPNAKPDLGSLLNVNKPGQNSSKPITNNRPQAQTRTQQ